MIDKGKLEKWRSELSKISRALSFYVHPNITRARSSSERRKCVWLNQVMILEKFVSYLIKDEEDAIERLINRWKGELRRMVREEIRFIEELLE